MYSKLITVLSGPHAVYNPGHPAHVHKTRRTMHTQRLPACMRSDNRLATCKSSLMSINPFQVHRLLIMSHRTGCLILSSPSPSHGKRASRACHNKSAPLPPQQHHCPGANLSLLPHAQKIFKILPASMLSNQTFTNLARWQSILLLEFSVCALSKIYLYWPSLMTSTRCSCLLIPQPVLTRYN